MKITVWSENTRREVQDSEVQGLLATETNLVWVDIHQPGDADIRLMNEIFHFHPLAIEDTRNHKQRPKIEEYPGYMFLIVNSVSITEKQTESIRLKRPHTYHDLDFREIDIFIGRNYVVTVHMANETVIDEVQRRIIAMETTMPATPGYLLYLILDAVVDEYFPVMDMLEEEIDKLEDSALKRPRQRVLGRIFELKHMLLHMWRVVWPQRDVLSTLLQPHVMGLGDKDTTQYYLRDVSDHLLWIADMIATYRDTLTTIIDLYMSSVSNRLNRVVNRLTVITLGFGMAAVITGFYGMNFLKTWPPFETPEGVPFVLGLLALVTGIVLYVLRKIEHY